MFSFVRGLLAAAACAVVLAGCGGSEPVVASSSTSNQLQRLQRPTGERVSVAIYNFRSEVPEVNARMASDMFVTALVQSGQFLVVERSQVNQNVMREKQMNAAGQTTGTTAQQQLLEARYLFEATVSEANKNASTNKTGVSVGGARISGGGDKDTIAIDVRIIDASNGVVLDSIAVRKEVSGGQAAVSGLGNLASTYLTNRGRTVSPLTPDVEHQSTRKESVDTALRQCIELAVLELSKRLQRPQ
jgi:curli biogenesis system outer membrane secretion channel CsgG